MGNMSISGAGAPAVMAVSGTNRKQEAADAFNEESGTIKMPEVKVAHSEKEAIRNRIESLREQIKTLDEAKDVDADTKRKMKEQITQQISDLNTQLLDVTRREAERQREKELEKNGGSADDARRFDRYEPSDALNKATSAGMQNAIAASNSIEQVKIQQSSSDRLQQRTDILKNEIKLDIKTGASTKEKEEELTDIKAKLRGANGKAVKDLNDPDEKTEPTYITYDGGLTWLEELRQRRAEERAGMQADDAAAPEENVKADGENTELSVRPSEESEE